MITLIIMLSLIRARGGGEGTLFQGADRETVGSLTWSSRHPCELDKALCFADHHLEPLGQGLVLQQDEELAQWPAGGCRTLPPRQRLLRAQALRRGGGGGGGRGGEEDVKFYPALLARQG